MHTPFPVPPLPNTHTQRHLAFARLQVLGLDYEQYIVLLAYDLTVFKLTHKLTSLLVLKTSGLFPLFLPGLPWSRRHSQRLFLALACALSLSLHQTMLLTAVSLA